MYKIRANCQLICMYGWWTCAFAHGYGYKQYKSNENDIMINDHHYRHNAIYLVQFRCSPFILLHIKPKFICIRRRIQENAERQPRKLNEMNVMRKISSFSHYFIYLFFFFFSLLLLLPIKI